MEHRRVATFTVSLEFYCPHTVREKQTMAGRLGF